MIATMLETETDTTTATATLNLADIHFADGDLTRPLYPTLINYPAELDPQVQVDLGIQVGTGLSALEITFELRANLGVQFAFEPEDSQRGKVRDLAGDVPAGVEVQLHSPLRCTLIWTRLLEETDRVRAFRIHCQKADPTDKERVYGGLFVAIINERRLVLPDFELGGPRNLPVDDLTKLELIGLDGAGRPLYNLFKGYSGLLSSGADLEIEPTYRLCESRDEIRELHIDFTLNVPADWTFNQELMFLDPLSARSLFGFTFHEGNVTCRFSWLRKAAGEALPETGVSTFHLGVSFGDLSADERVRRFVERKYHIKDRDGDETPFEELLRFVLSRFASVDPTVIEPPRCTGGICAD